MIRMRVTPPILTTLLIVILANSAHATTIVVARSADEIIIGADSKVTDTYGNDLERHACKIRQAGNLFIAFEGLAIDRQTGLNVGEIASTSLQMNAAASAGERVSILTGFLVSGLLHELGFLKKNAPETYFKKIEGGQIFLRVIVCGFEGGRPLVFVRSFKAAPISPQQIGVSVIADDCLDDCRDQIATRFVGETDAIDGLPEETPGFWQKGLVDGVRRLIETEIAARSEYVGPPIDILRIDRNGARWIQKKAECVNIEDPAKRPGR